MSKKITADNENMGNELETINLNGSESLSANALKSFRHHPDMENFYRFIFENDLRFEALAMIDEILIEKHAIKTLKAKGAKN